MPTFSPNEWVHYGLLHLAPQTDLYVSEPVEQGKSQFDLANCRFAAQQLNRMRNGLFPNCEADKLNVVQHKLRDENHVKDGLR